MANAEQTFRSDSLNIDFMRSLVKQYTELGQWTSALFWADAAAAAGSGAGTANGDDVWLLASAMLARGEWHRASYAVTSRGLHRRHLLCLGVAMRAYLSSKEPASALNLLDEVDPSLLEPHNTDQTHNRALAGVLLWQARALAALERREAAGDALARALRADAACYEALELLLDQHALTPRQELELVDSLPLSSVLGPAEASLVRAAYRARLLPPAPASTPIDADIEAARSRTFEAHASRARRLAASCRWQAALRELDSADPWLCPSLRAACLVELKRSSELFAFAHTLVDAYPHAWTSWFAVGCYYYLIGKSEFARRYLGKAKALAPRAGCVWLAYGHSFAADNEHDQAMAAYFKASQLMQGCHLPPLYVGVECSLLSNVSMCEKFLARAAAIHASIDPGPEGGPAGWELVLSRGRCPHVAHEAGAAALAHGQPAKAHRLWTKALALVEQTSQLSPRWACTMDALGHASRALGRPAEALDWHRRALALRPARASSLTAAGLCLALLNRESEAADVLHSALAKDPDDVVASALLDMIIDRLDAALTEEEVPQFSFPPVNISLPPRSPPPASAPAPASADATLHDMSMSFD